MKLAPRDVARFCARPDPARAGVLLFGTDPMRIALKRQELVANLVGPEGEAEMRLSRVPAAGLRSDPAALADAMKAQGFFPGLRVVLVEDATDLLAPLAESVLSDWHPEDARLVVTAGNLKPASKLRKLFEGAKTALAVGIYDDPPGRDEIEASLKAAGLTRIDSPAMEDLLALGQVLDPGDFRQTVEKIALYKLGDDSPLNPDDVAACAPLSTEADMDSLFDMVAEGRAGGIGPLLRRLEGQGVNAVALCIGAGRHFRALFAAHCDPRGPADGIRNMRPPLHWKRRDRMTAQAKTWSRGALERALAVVTETDLALRSATDAPSMAVMERALIRLAMQSRR